MGDYERDAKGYRATKSGITAKVIRGFGGDLSKIEAANRQRTRNKIRKNRAKRASRKR